MSERLDPNQLDLFRDAVAARLGLQFDEDRTELLETVATERLASLRTSLDAYLPRLAPGGDPDELRVLAERLTVGETYFFRNRHDLDAFAAAVLPERMRAREGVRRLRILSAGCSSGEEPWTLAMLTREVPALAAWDVSILGVDVNPAAIARARAGTYGTWSLRQTDEAARARFFRRDRRGFHVADELRPLVSFEERNLVDQDPRLWVPGAFDVVFCRNVTMYFAPDVTRLIVARIARSLAPGGYLFLGHAETLRGVSTAFHLRHGHDTFYYQLREGGGAEAPPSPAPSRRAAPAAAPIAVPDGGWVDAIRRASERIAHLATPVPGATAPPAAAAPVATPTPVPGTRRDPGAAALALELLKEERFADALAALGPASGRETDTDALLLRAVLLTLAGDPREAERTCARILELDELRAEAHYVMALCREHAGDRAGAADHDRYALYLDPTFSMPRLHLGLVAARAGERDAARRELARALVLLAAEEPSRILLLGGGFTRDALVELCRAELRAAGGTA
jgi:chemotaxis protein methyltransferase CheR